MEILDGWEMTKILRQNFPSLRIVACTAYAFDEAIQKCYKSGMD